MDFASSSVQMARIAQCAARLKEQGICCATAESCTGGMIGAALTELPGSSQWFCGGIIAYANEAKSSLLGVPQTVIEHYGAVSQPVVEQMAQGACRALGVDVAVAVSGVAGPDGGTPDKPVGTVCFGVCLRGATTSFTRHFAGDRQAVRAATVDAAIQAMCDALSGVMRNRCEDEEHRG